MNIYDIDDDDELVDDQPVEQEELTVDDQPDFAEEDDGQDSYYQDDELIDRLLQSKGINPESVKLETENGYETANFYDLSPEEQFEILNSSELDDDYGLDDDEINLINQIRENDWSVKDYNNYIAQQAVGGYVSQLQRQQQPDYEIDNISDDELYVLDLKSRIPDITEDDAMQELNNAKSNPSLYSKKINSIRDEYKKREDELVQQQQQYLQQQRQQQYNQMSQSVVNAINDSSSIDIGDSAIELSNKDKNDIANFILRPDLSGSTGLARALNDPHAVVGMVWYLLHGQEAFGQMSDYYKRLITNVARNNYTKGYDDAAGGRSANSTKAVVRRLTYNAPSRKKELTIDDLD